MLYNMSTFDSLRHLSLNARDATMCIQHVLNSEGHPDSKETFKLSFYDIV